MRDGARRLHWLSWIFIGAGSLKELAFPALGFVLLGQGEGHWALWGGALSVCGFTAWAMLSAYAYRYDVGEQELRIRDGVFDRTERHIPFSKIQGVSQRRKLLHRLLGVSELHLESAAGGKPEAVMKVLGLAAAAELELLLRAASTVDAPPPGAPAPHGPALHRLAPAEIVRLGLVSHHGVLAVGVLFGLVMQSTAIRQYVMEHADVPLQWLAALLQRQAASGHWSTLAVATVAALLLALLALSLLSVLLAFFRYHAFTLERQGEKLMVRQGLMTTIRASVRLPQLQSWLLEESWLQRRIGRCRLTVVSAGGAHEHEHEHGLSPGAALTELAPIATFAQALALLKICLPGLDWEALDWQALHHNTVRRRLFGQARWVAPALLALGVADAVLAWPLAAWGLGLMYVAVALVMWWHARAWARFAAYAEMGDVLLFRHGVWKKRWALVATARLQTLRLYSSPLDRRLGMFHVQADTQGGSRHRRALDIPCLGQQRAQALLARLWRQASTTFL